jgi:hypothetical protein
MDHGGLTLGEGCHDANANHHRCDMGGPSTNQQSESEKSAIM